MQSPNINKQRASKSEGNCCSWQTLGRRLMNSGIDKGYLTSFQERPSLAIEEDAFRTAVIAATKSRQPFEEVGIPPSLRSMHFPESLSCFSVYWESNMSPSVFIDAVRYVSPWNRVLVIFFLLFFLFFFLLFFGHGFVLFPCR
jgi:hypothetical protein